MEEAFDLHQELVNLGGDEYDASCFSEASEAMAEGNWGEISSVEEIMKGRIASHPLYPRLLNIYIDCQKMGAPPEMVSLLEEVRQGTNLKRPQAVTNIADPELDQFMVIYCEVLAKYRSDLARPFYEATSFINTIEKQLSDLCKNSALSSAEAARSSDESGGGEVVDGGSTARSEGRELKDELLRRYRGYLGSLKQDFSKKKKKGNLPKEARQTLLDWWNLHYKWPYPTDADKLALVECTGLNQKQINNWFINQRKRRWKPSESMQFAVLNTLSSSFYLDSPR